jgi:hypothetical protein
MMKQTINLNPKAQAIQTWAELLFDQEARLINATKTELALALEMSAYHIRKGQVN